MASPPIPPLEHLADGPFAFYPPILNVELNEWTFVKSTWSEIQVVNCRTKAEVWISRRDLGEVSRVDEPIRIVGLNRELELKGGMIVPFQRRVIEMPMGAGFSRASSNADETKPYTGTRLEATDRRILKLIGVAVSVLLGLYIVVAGFTRVGEYRQKRVVFTGRDQTYASLNSRDDYLGVKLKMGTPGTERQQEVGTILFRAMGYPDRQYTVILMGRDQGSLTYIGTVDNEWQPIHAVNAQDEALLRNLKRF